MNTYTYLNMFRCEYVIILIVAIALVDKNTGNKIK